MASITDVEQANAGEKITGETPITPMGSNSEVDDKYIVFKLKGNSKHGVHIDGQDDVVNPKTGKTERIRLLTGVDTIWMSEQKNIDKDYVNQNKRSLSFRGRVCRILETDSAAIEFARICNSNVGAPKRIRASRFEFFEYDPQKQAQEAYAKEVLEIEMATKANMMEVEEMKQYAAFVGIVTTDEVGLPKSDSMVRTELMLYAKRMPTEFKKLLDQKKEVGIEWNIRKAILSNTIDLGKVTGSAHWGTGGFICKIPAGQKPLKYLTSLAMTNSEDGKQFLQQLNSLQ